MINKILIHETDEMFIPYCVIGGKTYILSILWDSFDPKNKIESLLRFKEAKYVSVAVETERGGKVVVVSK